MNTNWTFRHPLPAPEAGDTIPQTRILELFTEFTDAPESWPPIAHPSVRVVPALATLTWKSISVGKS